MGKATRPRETSRPARTQATPAPAGGSEVQLDTTGGVHQEQLADIASSPGAGNSHAQSLVGQTGTDSGTGAGAMKPPGKALPAGEGGSAAATQEQGEGKEAPSEEAIDQGIADATAKAGPVQEGGEGEAAVAGDAGTATGPQALQTQGPLGPVAAAVDSSSVGLDGGMPLPSFQMEKAADPLSKWDNEVAWSDAFNSPGQCSQNFEVDRGALIADALSDGAVAGFKAGMVNTAMDTAVNLAATKIPYISGFVELAQLAYDPEAWLQAQSQATFGKFATGFDQILNGDAWDKVEGTVNLLSGAVGVIGLLTNICWIIAGVGFLASFICPALLPFVALCTSWATSLSAISGIAYLILSLLQLGLVGMRATEIAVSDADPQDLLESGKSLEKNTQGFTTAYTSKAAGNMRQRAANKLSGRNPAATPDTPYNRKPEGVDAPTGKGWKAIDLVTGNVGSQGGLGSGSKGTWNSAKGARGKLKTSQDAFLGKGDYQRGGDDGPANTTAQKLADMEHAGANVFTSTKAREDFYAKAQEADGQAVTSRVQTDAYASKSGYYADKDDAHAEMAAARRAKRSQAQSDLDDAQAAYLKAQADSDSTIQAKTSEVRARAALKSSYDEDLGHAKTRLTELESRRATAASALGDDPAGVAHLQALDSQISTAKTHLTQAQADVAEAQAFHQAGVEELKIARQPVYDAKGDVMAAEDNLASQSRMAELSNRRAQNSDNERIEMDTLGQKAAGGKGVDAVLAEEQKAADYDIYQAAAGNGPSAVHGMKRRHDRTLIKQVHANSTDDQASGGPLGLWQSTMDDKDIDWVGDGGKVMGESNDSDWFEQFLSGVRGTLPPAPIYCPDQVDGTAAAWEELEREEHELAMQASIAGGLVSDGQADVAELQGVQSVADANLVAVDQHQAALDERSQKQTAAVTQAQEAEGQLGEASGKADENATRSGGIVGRFLDMLGIVPTRILPGGQDAKDGMTQLGEASTAGVDATSTGAQGAREAQIAVAGMAEATTATQGTDQIAATELSAIQADAALKETSAQSGVEDLTETQDQAHQRLLLLAQEQERLEQVHDGTVMEAAAWTQVHESTRIEGLGEYADLLKLSDK